MGINQRLTTRDRDLQRLFAKGMLTMVRSAEHRLKMQPRRRCHNQRIHIRTGNHGIQIATGVTAMFRSELLRTLILTGGYRHQFSPLHACHGTRMKISDHPRSGKCKTKRSFHGLSLSFMQRTASSPPIRTPRYIHFQQDTISYLRCLFRYNWRARKEPLADRAKYKIKTS